MNKFSDGVKAVHGWCLKHSPKLLGFGLLTFTYAQMQVLPKLHDALTPAHFEVTSGVVGFGIAALEFFKKGQ